jgi:flagellar basal-body rod modification protein FlgD
MTTTAIQNSSAATAGAANLLGTASASAATIPNSFLTLLVTQLQNQDPLNPMDNSQLTSQLAQISTVNGIQQMNTTMQGLATSFSTGQQLQATSMIGHQVLTSGNSVTMNGGPVTAGVQLDGAASGVTVQILSATGAVVRTMELGSQQSGIVPFQWNGLTDSGAQAAAGGYTFAVKATSGSQTVNAKPLTAGNVSSVTLNGGSVGLNVDGVGNVPLSQIISIL